jgi:glycolate oxidase iron-sulfur subunit
MQHAIDLTPLGPQGPAMAAAVDACVHCGFCLATCPTYKVMGDETDSPRGRIYLMKSELEGTLPLTGVMPYVDRCLGCMACVTACPSGVEYGELLTPFRARAETQRKRPLMERLARTVVHRTLPYPGIFRLAATTGRLAKPLRKLLPSQFRAMLDLLPAELPPASEMPTLVSAVGTRRARVGLLAGCVQQILAPSINQATIAVLIHNGVEVVIPSAQGCCGSLALHSGESQLAKSFAVKNFTAFPDDLDAIITNAAGCGSGIHEYGLLFAGTPQEDAARHFAGKVQDISVFLDNLGLLPPPALAQALKVAYHDACHLAHAQRISQPPRRLLQSIPNLTLREIPEGEICCGSAGTYNLEQPELAHQIGRRKAENILSTGAEMIVTGNIGCMTQIRSHLELMGRPLPVLHTVELLAKAYADAA